MKYLVSFLLILGACAPKDKIIQEPPEDPIRQAMQWQSSGPWWATNISPANSGASDFSWVMAYDEQCTSHAVFGVGTITISASTQTSAVQPTDLPCSSFNGNWTWAALSGALVLCQNTPSVRPCVTFE